MVKFDCKQISRVNSECCVINYLTLCDKNALGSCGLFSVKNISFLVEEDYDCYDNITLCFDEDDKKVKEILTEIVIFGKYLNKYHCLCLDNEDDFEEYADFIRQFLVQENEYFINPSSGNKTKLFIIDVRKVEKYLTEKYNNDKKI